MGMPITRASLTMLGPEPARDGSTRSPALVISACNSRVASNLRNTTFNLPDIQSGDEVLQLHKSAAAFAKNFALTGHRPRGHADLLNFNVFPADAASPAGQGS